MGWKSTSFSPYKNILYFPIRMATIQELGIHRIKARNLDNDFQGVLIDELIHEEEKRGVCLIEGRPSQNNKYVVYDTARLSGEALGVKGDESIHAVGMKSTYAEREIPKEYGVLYLPTTKRTVYHPTLIESVIDASDVTVIGRTGGEDPIKIDGMRLVLPSTEAGKVHGKPDKLRDLLNSRMQRKANSHGPQKFRKTTCRGMEAQFLFAYTEANPLHQSRNGGLVLHEITPTESIKKVTPEPPYRVLVFPSFHHLEAPEGSINKNGVYVLYEAPNKSVAVIGEVDKDGDLIGIDNQDHPEKLDKNNADGKDYFSWVHDAIILHNEKYYNRSNRTVI